MDNPMKRIVLLVNKMFRDGHVKDIIGTSLKIHDDYKTGAFDLDCPICLDLLVYNYGDK